MVCVHKHNFGRQIACLRTQNSKGYRTCFLAISIRYQEGQGFKTQLEIVFCIVTDAGKTLWYLGSVPIVNLLVWSPGKVFWMIPVHIGLGYDVLPPARSPSQAAASAHGEHALELAGTCITAYWKSAQAPVQIQEQLLNFPVWMGML